MNAGDVSSNKELMKEAEEFGRSLDGPPFAKKPL